MRSAWLAWSGVCATVAAFSVAAACGGSAFTSSNGPDASSSGSSGGSGSSSGSGSGSSSGSGSGGKSDGGTDAGRPTDAGVALDGATCPGAPTRCGTAGVCLPDEDAGKQGYLCCISNPTDMPQFGCAACNCDPSATQLHCSGPGDCQNAGSVCCISPASNGGHVATCQPLANCTGDSSIMCDPGGQTAQCGPLTCSQDQSVLNNAGLPSGSGYGICK